MKITSQILDTEQRKGFLRVAFATSDSETINDHFGWARLFLIYDVSPTGYFKVGKIQFAEADEAEECNPENKHFAKIKALKTCHIVYSQSIGGPAAARLTQQKIHPLVAKDNPTIESVLNNLKQVLNGPTPPWLRKIIGREDPLRFESY
jgi:nitrogen fixation protein NifX